MFDQLMQHPVILALPPVLAIVFAFLLSRTIELVPTFARWWDAQPSDYKLAYRGWAGLPLAVLMVVFGYFTGLVKVALQTPADWLILVAAVAISWLLYVASAEATYKLTEKSLPRKQRNWTPG